MPKLSQDNNLKLIFARGNNYDKIKNFAVYDNQQGDDNSKKKEQHK